MLWDFNYYVNLSFEWMHSVFDASDDHYFFSSDESPPSKADKSPSPKASISSGRGTMGTHLYMDAYLYPVIKFEVHMKRNVFYIQVWVSIGLPCSKKRKHLEKIGDYWRQKAQTYKTGLTRPQK